MKKLMLAVFVSAIMSVSWVFSDIARAELEPVETTPTTPALVDGPLLISRYSFWGDELLHVEIFNTSEDVVDLTGWSLHVGVGEQTQELITIPVGGKNLIAPGAHRIIADEAFIPDASYVFISDEPLATTMQPPTGWRVVLQPPAPTVLDVVVTPSISSSTVRNSAMTPPVFLFARNISTTSGNYNTGYTAVLMDFGTFQPYDDGPYIPPPLNACTNLRLSEIGANVTNQFIEIYNASTAPMDIGGCVLQTNRSQTISYEFPHEILPSGALKVIPVTGTGLTLTKTTTGTVYILSSDKQNEVDAREYNDMSEGTSLALVDGVWNQTFTVTPGSANVYAAYPPCEAGYTRNLDTGRCNKVTISSALTPCKEGQYRSEETNRCRNVASASASLTPCDEGKERNPVTNRCRSVLAASSTLQPCATGKERNPTTNRCRNVAATLADTAYPVESIPNSQSDKLGWLAFGFVGVLAAGYGVWEWRSEIGAGLLRLRRAILKI